MILMTFVETMDIAPETEMECTINANVKRGFMGCVVSTQSLVERWRSTRVVKDLVVATLLPSITGLKVQSFTTVQFTQALTSKALAT